MRPITRLFTGIALLSFLTASAKAQYTDFGTWSGLGVTSSAAYGTSPYGWNTNAYGQPVQATPYGTVATFQPGYAQTPGNVWPGGAYYSATPGTTTYYSSAYSGSMTPYGTTPSPYHAGTGNYGAPNAMTGTYYEISPTYLTPGYTNPPAYYSAPYYWNYGQYPGYSNYSVSAPAYGGGSYYSTYSTAPRGLMGLPGRILGRW